MRLHPNWRLILMRAWSVRFMAMAGLASGLVAGLPLAQPFLNINPLFVAGIVGAAACVAAIAGIASRIVYQQDMH